MSHRVTTTTRTMVLLDRGPQACKLEVLEAGGTRATDMCASLKLEAFGYFRGQRQGLTYVALSRLRRLEGLRLRGCYGVDRVLRLNVHRKHAARIVAEEWLDSLCA